MRFLLVTLATAIVLLLVQGVLVYGFGLRAGISSSDLQTNIVRVQSLDSARDRGCIVLGSSISGRLRPEFFDLGETTVCVLGLDGLGAPFAAGILGDHGVEPAVLIVEANSLLVDNPGNAKALTAATSGRARTFARIVPLSRAEVRPSAIAYSALKSLKDGGGAAIARELPRPRPEPVPDKHDSAVLATIPGGLSETLRAYIGRGVQVVLVMLPDDPTGGKARPSESAAAIALAAELGIPYYDLRTQVSELGLLYSDGLHLTEPSARLVAELLSSMLEAPIEM